MPTDKQWAEAYGDLWQASSQIKWELGRLGRFDGTIPISGLPGEVYVRRGENGELGETTAIDKVGVALTANQRVKMRRELGRLVIREAEEYASGSTVDEVSELIDVDLTGLADGYILQWDAASGKWVPIVPPSGSTGAPSPHTHDGVHHSGTLSWANVNKSGSSLADLATRSHADLSSVSANQHHNQSHVLATNLALGGDHTISGATAGHVLRASSASAAAFAQLQHTDLGGVTANQHHNQVHSITGSDHTLTASQYQLVGATATNTLGLLTPSFNPGAAIAILRTDANGGIALDTALFVVEGSGNTVTIDTTLFAANATSHTVKFDTTVLVIDAAADTITAGGAATFSSTAVFNGNVTLNANGTFNTGVFTFNTDPQLNSNLDFIGGDRSITGSNNVTISPTTDLILDPGGIISLPTAQTMRTSTFTDSVTGIAGFSMFDTGGNVRQITTGKFKADEAFFRVVIHDEERVNRGAEFWSRSFGIVETAFTVPADEANVDVWFEESPASGSAKLFLPDNWLMIRQVEVSTGITAQLIWFQVVDAGANDYVTRQNASGGTMARQQWRLKRKSGGVTSSVIKPGNYAVDFGKPFSVTTPTPGQGVIYLSALDQDDGPFIQIQTFDSVVSDVPQFLNHVRMGNLRNTVDYGATAWGFAGGSDLGVLPSAGFSGFTIDAEDGLRVFNGLIELYDGSTKMISINKDTGMTLDFDLSAGATVGRYIRWQDDLNSFDADSSASIGGYKASSDNVLYLRNSGSTGTSPYLLVHVIEEGQPLASILQMNKDSFEVGSGSVLFRMKSGGVLVGAGSSLPSAAASKLHVYEDTSNTGVSAGLTVEQDSTGDALAQFLLTGGTRWVVGIDNSDADKFKIGTGALGAADKIIVTTGGDVGIGITPSSPLDVAGELRSSWDASNYVQIMATSAQSMQFNLVAASSNAQMDQSPIPLNGTGSATYRFFRNTNTSGLAAFRILRADGTSSVNTQLGANVDTYLAALIGNVAVGTTTPVSKLHIYQNDSATGTSAGITVEQDGTGDAALQLLMTGGQRYKVHIDNSDSDKLKIGDGSSDFVTVTAGGLIGIGTTAPGVDVVGTVDEGATELLHIDGTIPIILIRGSSLSVLDMITTGSTSNEKWFRIVNDAGVTSMAYLTDAASTVEMISMVHGSGFVGINNTAPTSQFVVDANNVSPVTTRLFGPTGFHMMAHYRALGSKSSPSQVVNNTIVGGIGVLSHTSSGVPASYNATLQAQATENHTNTARGTKWIMSVTKAGTASIATAMDLGDDRQAFFPGVYAHPIAGGGGVAANVYVSSDGWLRMVTSSARFKQDIRPLPYDDNFIDRLRPSLFRSIKGHGDPNVDSPGFIAEQVYAAGGEMYVGLDGDGKPLSVASANLTAPIILELQSLRRRVAELEARLN